MTQAEDTKILEIRTSGPFAGVMPGEGRLRVRKVFHPEATPESEIERFIITMTALDGDHDACPGAKKPRVTT